MNISALDPQLQSAESRGFCLRAWQPGSSRMTRVSAVAVQTLSERRMAKPSAVEAARANTCSSANNRFTPPQQQAAAAQRQRTAVTPEWSVSAIANHASHREPPSCIVATIDYQKIHIAVGGASVQLPNQDDDVQTRVITVTRKEAREE